MFWWQIPPPSILRFCLVLKNTWNSDQIFHVSCCKRRFAAAGNHVLFKTGVSLRWRGLWDTENDFLTSKKILPAFNDVYARLITSTRDLLCRFPARTVHLCSLPSQSVIFAVLINRCKHVLGQFHFIYNVIDTEFHRNTFTALVISLYRCFLKSGSMIYQCGYSVVPMLLPIPS